MQGRLINRPFIILKGGIKREQRFNTRYSNRTYYDKNI